MAVSVDTVYKTVLYILNKEQRGYITPDEFNKLATQVQLEIFEQYFEELNQQIRVPENDSEYANRVKNLDEKIDIFKRTGNATFNAGYFYLPTDMHRLGTIIYDNKEVQRIQRNEFLLVDKSPLTKPTVKYPVYILEGTVFIAALHNKIFVYPTTIQSGVSLSYIIKPIAPAWGYTVDGTTGAYIYSSGTSTNFDLHSSEQTNLILQILMYSGVIIRDPQIVQNAAQMVQQDELIEKS